MGETLSLNDFHRAYETEEKTLQIKNRSFTFFVPKSLNGFVDKEDIFQNFPLWSKIWEASIVLADHLAGIKPEPGRCCLEIGCGVGVAGIVAASFGHRFVSTESNTDALEFAKANAAMNGLADNKNLEIQRLDWNRPLLEGMFDLIVGSEVIYSKAAFKPILGLFKTYLKKDGEIILAEGVRETSLEFFRLKSGCFNMTARKMRFGSGEDAKRIILCTMAPQ